MKHSFWKLLHYEIDRFSKIYGAMALLTLVVQWVSTVWMAKGLVERMELGVSARSGHSFITYSTNPAFLAPIALCAAALLLYVFLIWYRDWFGKHTFIYRLLMLPAPRMNIYWAKLSAILIFVLGLIAFQLITLPLHLYTFNSIVPEEARDAVSTAQIVMGHQLFKILIPLHIYKFLMSYITGLAGVAILFTVILTERSYRLRGLILGILYLLITATFLMIPTLLNEVWYPRFFYPSERVFMEAILGLLILCFSVWLSSYLIRHKITV
ncbi:hypothetical protein ACVNS2_14310 [Paenibacillus caseinilyticus]|uniref:Uncharacterized protein n=1 Tax=Paenibacillus mucilaginosus K02 TaxID=997761 RepID=I0BHG5_9BACL|nr:hypothetical protein [Paenibacillus mucilaginosus]AFH61812.1 hypothetical protein B2K_13990 [Paenibacillus mucilaginosus K02]